VILPILAAVGFVGLLALPRKRRRRSAYSFNSTVDSASEGMADVLTEDGVNVDFDDATMYAIGDALGWPYRWGAGNPSTPWADGDNGVDCSGFVQMALVKLGKLAASSTDRGAIALANAANPIVVGHQRPGDFAVYRGQHVMLVVSGPRTNIGLHSHVMGASGGGNLITLPDGSRVRVQGYDPNAPGYSSKARVKAFSTALYRKDFLTYARLR
jgi:hypothetical protein